MVRFLTHCISLLATSFGVLALFIMTKHFITQNRLEGSYEEQIVLVGIRNVLAKPLLRSLFIV